MYSFSFVVASRYALPMSAPRLSCCSIWLGILIALGILLKLLQNRCYLLDQELGHHQLLVGLYVFTCKDQVYFDFLVLLGWICDSL